MDTQDSRIVARRCPAAVLAVALPLVVAACGGDGDGSGGGAFGGALPLERSERCDGEAGAAEKPGCSAESAAEPGTEFIVEPHEERWTLRYVEASAQEKYGGPNFDDGIDGVESRITMEATLDEAPEPWSEELDRLPFTVEDAGICEDDYDGELELGESISVTYCHFRPAAGSAPDAVGLQDGDGFTIAYERQATLDLSHVETAAPEGGVPPEERPDPLDGPRF